MYTYTYMCMCMRMRMCMCMCRVFCIYMYFSSIIIRTKILVTFEGPDSTSAEASTYDCQRG